MKNLILGLILIFILSSCVAQKDLKNMSIEDMKEDCKAEDKFKSCYKLGNEALKNNDIKSALRYYSQGCDGWTRTGFFNNYIIFRKDINSCLKEAEILLKDYKNLSIHTKRFYNYKLEYVANYYFNNEDFIRAYEYYQAFIKEEKSAT